ncbi:MAG: hypothetical protein KGS44_00095 [Alphaproteobacteria bacterium]|jgi:hypothetical protein|nr:hypothetical protein [Alphaproteobacteria bacterium]
MLLAQRRRQIAYRLRRRIDPGVDNEPLSAQEHLRLAENRKRLEEIARTARRRARRQITQRVLFLGAAIAILVLATATGAFL